MPNDADRIPLARPAIGEAERAAADRALASGRLVLGPENRLFEEALAERCGRSQAVTVASGTAALELSLWALGLEPGDEVLVTAFGFVAAANAVVRAGGVPVPVDVDPRSWTIDAEAAASAVTDRTVGILSIDQLGVVAEAAPLEDLAATQRLWLIEDAACGLGGTDPSGVPGGGYGRLATLSFHPRKVVTTGEGGAIVTDDDLLAELLIQLRNHGQRGPGDFARVGTNARLPEVAAAVGCAQLATLGRALAGRQLLASGYRERLEPLVGRGRLSLQEAPDGARSSHQTFAALLGEGVDRAEVIAALDRRGIESAPATYAFHRLESFAHAAAGRALPVADALHDRALALPLYLGMRSAELDRVAEALKEALR